MDDGVEGSEGSVSAALAARMNGAIDAAGGWIPFSRFMAIALYEPGLGYYASGRAVFGTGLRDGSDFVTAPELSPLFGAALARQVGEALDAAGADEVFEFGAGSGALAAQLLGALGERIGRYTIVELAAPLCARQAEATRAFAPRVRWLDAWPEAMRGVVVGNEVLDAMPVDLLHFDGAAWHARGVTHHAGGLAWADRPGAAPPPLESPMPAGATIETHDQAEAFVAGLGARLERGAAFFVDYGFPAAEYYHPQRAAGTLACHRGHRVDFDPLEGVGEKDITAHVDFSGVALAAQDAGLTVAGYTSQARFLLNCGIGEALAAAGLRERTAAQRLLHEHEMGELFKAIALTRGVDAYRPLGFASGDRRHRL